VTVRLFTWEERPDLAERGPDSADVWPEYNLHGDAFDDWWEPLLDAAQSQLALYDEETDTVLAEGHTGPFAWNGDDAALPDGIDAALEQAVTARRDNRPVDTLCAFAAEVASAARERGLAADLLRGMSALAARHGLKRLIAPVRPSWKERYPLAPIERYVAWRREDGQLLDPWMRLHERLGSRHAPPALAAHQRQRRRLGELDRPGLPAVRRVHVPAGARAGDDRPRARPRSLLGAERVARAPGAHVTGPVDSRMTSSGAAGAYTGGDSRAIAASSCAAALAPKPA
jgi:hypothetical protein